jgi:large subunit ribosomal protein L21
MKLSVIKTGGKQYLVASGDLVTIEKLPGDHKVGDKIVFDDVLLVTDDKDTTIGAPAVKGESVTAEIVDMGKLPTVTVIKYKAKSNYFKKRGHRQPYFQVKIA